MRGALATTALLLLAASQSIAFQQLSTFGRARTTTTTTWAKKKKGSGLGEVAASGGAVPRTRQKPRKASSSTKKSVGSSSSGAVSPALADWASSTVSTANNNDDDDDVPTATTSTPEEQEPVADTFVRFKEEKASKKSSRRVKQSARKELQEKRQATVARIIDNLNAVLEEKKNSLDDILNAIRPILNCTSGNLRLLTAGTASGGSKQYNYRLAWVGSDDALCHIGTGLHKVPLARMQEVFLTLQGKGRIEILEILSILGPFPNVRNILQGDSKVKRLDADDATTTEWEIVMDSMIDGTGKEIPAGTDDNIRRAKLQVYFCDESAILAVVPPEESDSLRDDPLEDNGANALLFVREDDLDGKLDMLRVS